MNATVIDSPVLRTVPEITVPLSPFALRKMRGFRGAKDDTKFQNGPYLAAWIANTEIMTAGSVEK